MRQNNQRFTEVMADELQITVYSTPVMNYTITAFLVMADIFCFSPPAVSLIGLTIHCF